ncbi:hypothetical protein FOB82_02195 [Corynebacterium xerosis]|uniref:Uncharacterized protein n=1 Tax=Corynebacterium xerosis TaxID=1725 RepID=A0A6B8TRB5_9CORY|nr:hypothetical protein [Corynebacterium xerosis]QGS33930.1 hypothetical protein FOB82_02195 [Corynebacterium xerosis]
MMEDHGRDGYENRESVWRRSVSSAKYAAGERVRFHPVLVLVLIAIAWGIVAAMNGLDASLSFLPWAVALAYPVLAVLWVVVFLAVQVMALILLPLGDGVEGLLEKRAVRKNKRRRSGDVARRDQFNRWDRGGNSYF